MAFRSGENMRCSGEPDRSPRYIDGLANQKAKRRLMPRFDRTKRVDMSASSEWKPATPQRRTGGYHDRNEFVSFSGQIERALPDRSFQVH